MIITGPHRLPYFVPAKTNKCVCISMCEALIKDFSPRVKFTTTILVSTNLQVNEQELRRIMPNKFNHDWVLKKNHH